MTALGIEFSSRDPDLFYWPEPSSLLVAAVWSGIWEAIDERKAR